MIKIENTEVLGWEAMIRGMRNPMNSWEKSDSEFIDDPGSGHDILGREISCEYDGVFPGGFVLGNKDHELMTKLARAGRVDAKYRRMIVVYTDILAPLYWWKEFDTYKVGTVANSCSTMHKIAAKEFTLDDFSCEHLCPLLKMYLEETIGLLNFFRETYISFDERSSHADWFKSFVTDYGLRTKKDIWWQMIQLLPSSYNQRRTVMLNYEVLANMYASRKEHKLDEWRDFCKWIEGLPYSEIITLKGE